VLVSVGAVVLRGALAALLGVALYHNIWTNLASSSAASSGRRESQRGLKVKEMESLHLASRLSPRMFLSPSAKMGWFIGILGFIVSAAIVPVLQAGIEIGNGINVVNTTFTINHSQLDPKMAAKSGAQLAADDAMANVKRAAIIAVFGEQSSHTYTTRNITGDATFGPIDYADLDCSISVTPGVVPLTTKVYLLILPIQPTPP